MHMQLPAYDTRRGSSLHRGVEGYADADAIEDRQERERALAAVRSAGNRERRVERGAPSAHQVNAIIADAMGLLIDDPTVHAAIKSRLRECLRRAIRYRNCDPASPEVRRVVLTRMRANPKLLEAEAQERIAAEVEASMERRRSVTYSETVRLLDSLRDDDDGR